MTASRRRQRTGATALALVGILSLMAAFMPGIASADPPEGKKVAVCKYVGKPGVDERLKDGKNPIEVAVNSIQNNQWDGTLPGYFSDAHDRSYVLGYIEDGPFDVDDCPAGDPETFEVVPDKEWVGEVPEGAEATIEVQVDGSAVGTFTFDDEGNLVGDTEPVELEEGTEYTIVETSVGGVEGWSCEDVTADQADPVADTIYNACEEDEGEEPETFDVVPAKVWVGGAPAGALAVIEVQVDGSAVGTFTFDDEGNLVGDTEPVELEEGTEYAIVEVDVVSPTDWDCDEIQVDAPADDTIYNECVEEDDEPPATTSNPPTFGGEDDDDGDDGVGGEVVDNDGDDVIDEDTASVGAEVVVPEAAPQMLPRTGARSVPLAAGGAVALLMGLVMLAATRRTDATI